MIRFLTGLAIGLMAAYLTALQPGRQLRTRLVNFTRDEIQGFNILKQQWNKTVLRAKQARDRVKAATGFFTRSPS